MIASLHALARRKFTPVLAAIFISSPVAGFLPLQALRFCFTSLRNPGRVNEPRKVYKKGSHDECRFHRDLKKRNQGDFKKLLSFM
jgi:hypothetical protein